MIYTDSELTELILSIKDKPETEIIEFKEAVSNYSFNDIGKYFGGNRTLYFRGMRKLRIRPIFPKIYMPMKNTFFYLAKYKIPKI